MVDPSPTNYFQQKKSLKISGLDPLKKNTLKCDQCSAACFSFLGGLNFAETFRYASTKESQKVFSKITPFFSAGKATTNLALFFQSELYTERSWYRNKTCGQKGIQEQNLSALLCVWVGNVALVRVKYCDRGNIAPNLPNVFILFFGR